MLLPTDMDSVYSLIATMDLSFVQPNIGVCGAISLLQLCDIQRILTERPEQKL